MDASAVKRVSIVTGAARGIGRAVALHLASSGHALVLCDKGTDAEGFGHDPVAVEETATQARNLGADVVALALDAMDAGTPDALVAATRELGTLHGVVHAAGFSRERTALQWAEEDLEHICGVHLLSALRLTRAGLRAMLDHGHGGAIVLMTSPSGLFGAARHALAAAAAGGIAGFVRSAALEQKRNAIRINAIAPTARTRLTENLPLFQGIRPDAMGVDYVASVAAFLLSDEAQDVSGEVIGVAGPRVYALKPRESAGAFFDESGSIDAAQLSARWREVVRG